jgi:hypothetical protein
MLDITAPSHSTTQPASTPALASSRSLLCLTQRTYAIELWVARNTAWYVPTILEEGILSKS